MKILFTTIPQLARVLSRGTKMDFVLMWLRLTYFAFSRKLNLRGKDMEFSFFFAGKQFKLFLSHVTDLAVLHEVFFLKEYEWKLQNTPTTILDLGAHWGDSSIYYHFMYPDAIIYAVEPAPDTYAQLVKNVANISNIVPIQAGVSNFTGTADLNISSSSFGNSFQSRPGMQKMVIVPVYTMQDLFSKLGIKKADIIKFDIEGGEESLFFDQNPEEFADAYIGEVHRDLISINVDDFVSKFINFDIQQEQLKNPNRFILRAIKKYDRKLLNNPQPRM
ncbi:MAG: FkbM family methyltransferase [Minisyncoccia bacterium]